MEEEGSVSLQEFREMLAESARRIEVLEKATRDGFEVILRLQENQERLLAGFETYSGLQNRLNADLTSVIQRLNAEIEHLKGGGLVM